MRAYRKERLSKFENKLRELGYPVQDNPQTYEPWKARARLVEQEYGNVDDLRADVSAALRHIARHRGWRNPWLSWGAFTDLPKPSSNHLKNLKLAGERFGRELPEHFTVGQLGALGARKDIVTRPRSSDKSRVKTQGVDPLFKEKVLQEDHLFEMERYWDVQALLPVEHKRELIELVLRQNAPRVPQENVGKDELPGMKKFFRASRASLEFQEFRIRAAVANLQIKQGREKRALAENEYEVVYSLLSEWHVHHLPSDIPVWADVAEALEVSPAHLVTPALDDVVGNNPPINRTMDLLLHGVEQLGTKAKKPIKAWFGQADAEQVRMFVSWLSDVTDGKDELLEKTGLADIVADWDTEALEKLADIELENGRAAYSVESLTRLNQRMAADRAGLHGARMTEFGVDDSWRPTPPNLDEGTGHPTVDQNLTAVRRFLMGAVEQWGLPISVNVEHVRSAFMGVAALNEYRNEQRRILRQRDRAKEELRGLLPHEPTRRDARRMEYVQQQNSQCAYCGTTIRVRDCELDHIVPRADGGASTRANLVAVCRTCNQSKGRLPFAVWAARDKRAEVSVDEAVNRAKNWLTGRRTTAAERRINRETVLRLKQREEDQPLDERSMESTAYAARALRERMDRFLSDAAEQQGAKKPVVGVYRGSVVSAARKASEIDSMIRLRGKDIKDRGDFRHHAVDAAVIALMRPSVSQVLAIRENRRNAEFWDGHDREWKNFHGAAAEERVSYKEWKLRSQRLGEVVRNAIRADEIAVINPMRLGRNTGPVHKDTVRPLQTKSVRGEWRLKDAKRIVDKNLYLEVKHALNGASKPTELPEELVYDLKDRGLEAIEVFEKNAAQLVVRGGSAEYGSIHHARIYAWKNKKGVTELGILRVFSGEIAKMWPNPNTDILTAKVPEWAMSRRDVQPKTEAALDSGAAVQVGWVAPGDELRFAMQAEPPKTVTQFGEEKWVLEGAEDSGRLNVRPLYISSEGLDGGAQEELVKMMTRGARLSVSGIWGSVSVVRRSYLGFPRDRARRLPSSFTPMREAERLLR
ncbi:type II CRISPR RNA-guided endonuclease Cas9 [Nesterenkonia populi]